MDESIKTGVAELVGQILEDRRLINSNQERIDQLNKEIDTLMSTNKALHTQVRNNKQLVDYVLETGEDPVAARLQLTQKEIAAATRRGRKIAPEDTLHSTDHVWDSIRKDRSPVWDTKKLWETET